MIVREIILALAQVVDLVFTLYIFIIVARAILSWVNPDPYNPIVRFLHSATDPVLYKIQRWVPMTFGGIDFSPLVLLVALTFLQRVIHAVFIQLASSF
ncbi:MAG: YggT family protein [Deltaproteobacteria bacterium]|nr:YggT family protein [Deltaproteobacteria bacterium]